MLPDVKNSRRPSHLSSAREQAADARERHKRRRSAEEPPVVPQGGVLMRLPNVAMMPLQSGGTAPAVDAGTLHKQFR